MSTNQPTKTHWRKCDKSDYLGAADLDENHGDLNVTIERVEMKEVNPTGTRSQLKRVAHFKEDIKPMIINVANGKILKKFSGSKYIEDWVNISVSIYVLNGIKFGGDITEGIRFRELQSKPKKEILTKSHPRYSKALEALIEGNTDLEKIESVFELSEEVRKEFVNV